VSPRAREPIVRPRLQSGGFHRARRGSFDLCAACALVRSLNFTVRRMITDTTKVLLATAYLALSLFLAWPLIAYPQMAGKLPNILAIAFLVCSILTMLVRLPTPIVITVAALNAAAGLIFIAWIAWAVYTGPVAAPDRNLIPLVFYFTVITPIVMARRLFTSIQRR
jgi:hypothetical protein